MVSKTLHDAEERMKKTLEATRREVGHVRAGRATPALLDTVRVEYYGTPTPLQQVASVGAPEPRLLVVQPWDRSLVKTISKAIQIAGLGLNPTDDGIVVRVPIPQLTEERRRELVKQVGKLAEEGRVHLRQVRHDVNKEIKALEEKGDFSEDESKRLTADIQKLTDRYVAMIDELLAKKTAEVMEV